MTTPAIHYRIEAAHPHAHLYEVTLTVAQPAALQRVSLPVWIPGSYLVREFSRHLQGLSARQGRRVLGVQALDKCTWEVACSPGVALVLRYQVYAFDPSVRTAYLDARRGFFNGTSLCLRVEGQEDQPHELTLAPVKGHADWRAATALEALEVDGQGFGNYFAPDYDALVDAPFELGLFWQGEFTAGGIAHRFVVTGALPSFDGHRLIADTEKICQAALTFWHGETPEGAPHRHYLFILHAVDDGYGGLEHRESTALICGRRDLPRQGDTRRSDGYITLLGLISHEYFHTWNVKRLRPDVFARYDYTRENYTELLWFFEGFTSYFDDLLLRRAGLIDDQDYLKLLNTTVQAVLNTPGRKVQSVAQASFDAWVKYYRMDENTINATVSYYTKGALVGLCLDLQLRQEGQSLDALMRALWQRCEAGPMSEADLRAALTALTGRDWDAELTQWVHGTEELPLAQLLPTQGVKIEAEPAPLAQRLGVKVGEAGGQLVIKQVLRGSAAEQAGLSAGDEWIGVEIGPKSQAQAWRVRKLDDVATYLGSATQCVVLVARDQQLLRLGLHLPEACSVWKLRYESERHSTWPGA